MDAFPRFDAPLSSPLRGEIPSPANLPPGCRFQSRCPQARAECLDTDPPLTSQEGREAACLFPLQTAVCPDASTVQTR